MEKNKEKIINKREEIIFFYDIKNANPNGDPDEENRPREDFATGKVLVSDLRIKRTIRDYLISTEKDNTNQILVQRKHTPDLKTMQMDELIFELIFGKNWQNKKKEYEKKNGLKNKPEEVMKIREALLKHALDVRAFGSVTTLDNFPWTFTGAVQFAMGMSLNIPTILELPISPIVATKEAATSGSLGNYKVVDYALIGVPGVVCPYIAKENEFSVKDLDLVYKSLWNGTKFLHSRSKAFQIPRLLLGVVSKNADFQIGGLTHTFYISKESNITDIYDVEINIDKFMDRVLHFKKYIHKIKINLDPDITFISNGTKIDFEGTLKKENFNLEEFTFINDEKEEKGENKIKGNQI